MCDMYITEYCERTKKGKKFIYLVVDTNNNKSNGTNLGRFASYEDAAIFLEKKLFEIIGDRPLKGFITSSKEGNVLDEAWVSNNKSPDTCILKLIKVETI